METLLFARDRQKWVLIKLGINVTVNIYRIREREGERESDGFRIETET